MISSSCIPLSHEHFDLRLKRRLYASRAIPLSQTLPTRREYGSLALLSFWEPVRPAILPPEPGASTATAAPAPVLQTETEPGDGMARSLALLVARVGGDPSGLSLDSLWPVGKPIETLFEVLKE